MQQKSQRIVGWLALLGAIFLGLVGLVSSAQAQTRQSLELSVAAFDKLFATLKPGETNVNVGDMRYPVDELKAWRNYLQQRLAGGISVQGAFGTDFNNSSNKWPNATVGYSYDSSMPPATIATFEQAIFLWQKAANLRFTKRSSGDYLNIKFNTSTPGTSDAPMDSWVGRQFFQPQVLNVADWGNVVDMAHELGHSLGMIHEQQRTNRDTFVTINTANFDPSYSSGDFTANYAIVPNSLNQGTYDFDSLMHYPRTVLGQAKPAGAILIQVNPSPTDPNQQQWSDGITLYQHPDGSQDSIYDPNGTIVNGEIGQKTHLSASDIAAMGATYGNPLSISGRVTDGSGNGLQGAVITCTSTDFNNPYRGPTVNTLADGTYTLPGTSTGSYSVSASLVGRGFKPRSVTLTNTSATGIDFIPSAVIARTPSSMGFSVYYNANTAANQTFKVSNIGGSGTTLNWTVTENSPFLNFVGPTTGTSTGEEDTVTVAVNASGLGAGSYSTTITISDPNASNNSQTINVTLYRGGEITYTGNADNLDCIVPPQVGVAGDPTDWRDNRNWGSFCDILSRVPNEYDKAIIGNVDHVGEFQVMVAEDEKVGALELGFSCSLTGRGTLTVNKTIDWTQGTGTNAGSIGCNLLIPLGCVFDIRGGAPRTIEGATITNQGTINWTGGGLSLRDTDRNGTSVPVQILNFGTFRIIDTTGSAGDLVMHAFDNTATPTVFNNSGTLESDPGAANTVTVTGVKFNNGIMVNVKSGVLSINTGDLGGNHSGTFQTATGTTFALIGNQSSTGIPIHTFADTTRFTGPGQSFLRQMNLAGTLTAGASAGGSGKLVLTDGLRASNSVTLKTLGAGVLDIGTPVFGSGGTGLFGGTWTIPVGSTVSFADDTNGQMGFAAAKLDNQGTLNVRKDGFYFLEDNLTFTNSGTLNIEMDDTFAIGRADSANLTTLTNTGTINKNNANINAITAGIKVVNTGTINGNGGILRFTSGQPFTNWPSYVSSFGGTLKANAGGFIDLDGSVEQQLNNTLITGAGRVRVKGGFVKLIGTVTAGTTTLGGTLELAGGNLSGPSTSKITGPGFLWTSGRVTGQGMATNTNVAGYLNIDANGTMTIGGEEASSTSTSKLIDGNTSTGAATINNAGTVNWIGGEVAGTDGSQSGFSQFATFSNTGTFNIVSNDPDPNARRTIYGLGTDAAPGFVNTGTLNKSGSGLSTIHNIRSTNRINAQVGILALVSGIGSGTFNADAGGIIELYASAASQAHPFKLGDTSFTGLGRTRVPVNGAVQQDGNLTTGNTVGLGTLELQAGTFYGSPSSKAIHGVNLIWTGSTLSDRLDTSFQVTIPGFLNIASDGVLTIEGTVPKSSGATSNTGASIRNSGRVDWNDGQLLFADTIGLDNLAGAIFNARSDDGIGNVFAGGLIRNAGTMNLGTATTPYVLNIAVGSFEQTATGKLNVKIAGTEPGNPGADPPIAARFDQIVVGNGTLKVAGTLGVKLLNGYVPPVGAEFPVLSGGPRSGTFAAIEDQTAGDDRYLRAIYNATDVTLIAQDQTPNITINNVTTLEANTGATTNAVFTISLSNPALVPITVKAISTNGTAVAPGDYTALPSTTVTFAAGETTKTVTVAVQGDALDEDNETFKAMLSAPSGGVITDAEGIGTIADNDATPSVSMSDITITEGTGVVKNAVFTVKLSAPSGRTVGITCATADGTARTPADYTASRINLSFAPGQTSKTFSVPIKTDSTDEVNEVFYALLSLPVNTGVARARALCTINDDDAAPKISIDDISIGEGHSGTRSAVFHLTLSQASGQVVKVNFATAAGSTFPATAGTDFVAVAPTTVSFSAGSTVALARVVINGDLLDEENETYKVNLTSPINATIADAQGIGTITDDDAAPALSINDVSISEGNSGTKNLTFSVTQSVVSAKTISVNYGTADGTARSTSDYTARSGTLTFAPGGVLSKTVTVAITGDTVLEGDETFYVFLSGQVNASVAKARGVGTITNDDGSG